MASGDSPGFVRLHLRSPLNRHHCPDLGDISSQQQVQRHQHQHPRHHYPRDCCHCPDHGSMILPKKWRKLWNMLSNERFTCLSHVFVCLFCLYWISL